MDPITTVAEINGHLAPIAFGIATIGPAIGVGIVVGKTVESVARRDIALARAVVERDAAERPALFGFIGQCAQRRFGHRGIMFEGQRDQPAVAAHKAGETGDCTDAIATERGNLRPRIEGVGRDADGDHPPVTGGKNAISFAPPMSVSKRAMTWSTATRSRSRSAKIE